MELNEQTEKLFHSFLIQKVPGDVTFDGNTITHSGRMVLGGNMPIVLEFQYFIDDLGLHMQGSFRFDVTDPNLAGRIRAFYDGTVTERREAEQSTNFMFGDGKATYKARTLRFRPGRDPSDLVDECWGYEEIVVNEAAHVAFLLAWPVTYPKD